MKAIICELCNSRDVIKENGEYICRGCGAKYSVAEARNLMIEVDEPAAPAAEAPSDADCSTGGNSDFNVLLETAELFYKKGDYVHALDQYNDAAKLVPEDWRVIFFSACCKARTCRTSQIPQHLKVLSEYSKDLPPLIYTQLLDFSVVLPTYIEYFSSWLEVNKCAIHLLRDAWSNTHTTESQSMYLTTALESYAVQISLADNWLNNPILKEETNIPSFMTPLIKLVRELYDELAKLFEDILAPQVSSSVDKTYLRDMLESWTETFLYTKTLYPFIHETEPGYVHPAEKQLKERLQHLEAHPELLPKAQSGGCYVATAVYGSYNCPAVWTLRRFRDNTLAQTWYGKAFIRTYYAISPTLVKWFGHNQWFKSLWKPCLDRLVEKLNARGIENTPYNDRSW